MRHSLLLGTLLLVGLTGCAHQHSHPNNYGNFVAAATPEADQKHIIHDSVTKLVMIYPPAKTSLILRQQTPDQFGIALVHALRMQGYSIAEIDPTLKKPTPDSSTPVGLPLHYILDKFDGSDLYRITILIGEHSLTRAYSDASGQITPAGAWVHKE